MLYLIINYCQEAFSYMDSSWGVGFLAHDGSHL